MPAQHEDRQAVRGDDDGGGPGVVELPDGAGFDSGMDDVLGLPDHGIKEGVTCLGLIAEDTTDVAISSEYWSGWLR